MATIVRVSAFVDGVPNPVPYFRYTQFSDPGQKRSRGCTPRAFGAALMCLFTPQIPRGRGGGRRLQSPERTRTGPQPNRREWQLLHSSSHARLPSDWDDVSCQHRGRFGLSTSFSGYSLALIVDRGFAFEAKVELESGFILYAQDRANLGRGHPEVGDRNARNGVYRGPFFIELCRGVPGGRPGHTMDGQVPYDLEPRLAGGRQRVR